MADVVPMTQAHLAGGHWDCLLPVNHPGTAGGELLRGMHAALLLPSESHSHLRPTLSHSPWCRGEVVRQQVYPLCLCRPQPRPYTWRTGQGGVHPGECGLPPHTKKVDSRHTDNFHPNNTAEMGGMHSWSGMWECTRLHLPCNLGGGHMTVATFANGLPPTRSFEWASQSYGGSCGQETCCCPP